jgi:hypothetical protein
MCSCEGIPCLGAGKSVRRESVDWNPLLARAAKYEVGGTSADDVVSGCQFVTDDADFLDDMAPVCWILDTSDRARGRRWSVVGCPQGRRGLTRARSAGCSR